MRPCLALLLTLAAVNLAGQEPIRTADITVRGLKPADFPRIRKLADNVYSYEQIDPTKRVVTVNNLIVVTTNGVLIAESQGTVENVQRLIADVATLTKQPITYLVVGSEHGDHVGGIEAFPKSVTVLASPYSAPKLKRSAEAIPETKKVLTLGGTEIDILFLGRAHTGGDLEVYLPREKILFMSEVFVNRVFPSMANGYPSEWIATLRKAEAIAPAWFVPAHGFVDSADVLREEERNYRLAIERVVAEGKRLHDAGVPVDQALARADFGPYAGWTRRENNAAGALQRVYLELEGKLQAAAAAAPSIQGRWKLLAAEDLRADGTTARYPWGRQPAGSIVVEGTACYVQIMSTDTPSFSAATPSPVEQMRASLLSSYIAYSGPCTIDEAAGKVTLKVDAAWRPDYVGTEQVRFFRFDNGRLLFGPAPGSIRSGDERLSRRLTLERVH
ncbi:MAG TPA: lipocalin-like domain-containing protein [Vicinamibacterales bacterium]|nr:lipocalin-like domain-containing protein [Vicinamibacterales bacterium]